MNNFETSLLREKFVLVENQGNAAKKPTIALSNRIAFALNYAKYSIEQESFVVRAQSMHLAVRMTARILAATEHMGPITTRPRFDWQEIWNSLVNDYEYAYNPSRWIAVYEGGRVLFESGERHPLLDLIEKCDVKCEGVYDQAVVLAEKAFAQSGKPMKITHEGNVALVVALTPEHGRLAHILRGSGRRTTFNVSIASHVKPVLNFAQCLSMSASFLEGIQLSYLIGTFQEKIKLGVIKRHSKEEKQTREANQRLGRLSAEITTAEEAYKMHYRPEKPIFAQLIVDAEEMTRRNYTPDV